MLAEYHTQAIAGGVLLFTVILLVLLPRKRSDDANRPTKAFRKAAKSIKNLEDEIRVLNDCCIDAINHDTTRVRWNLLMAKARNNRARTALENEDLNSCLNWLTRAQWAFQIANVRFNKAPSCRYAGQAEVTINYLDNNW